MVNSFVENKTPRCNICPKALFTREIAGWKYLQQTARDLIGRWLFCYGLFIVYVNVVIIIINIVKI